MKQFSRTTFFHRKDLTEECKEYMADWHSIGHNLDIFSDYLEEHPLGDCEYFKFKYKGKWVYFYRMFKIKDLSFIKENDYIIRYKTFNHQNYLIFNNSKDHRKTLERRKTLEFIEREFGDL